MGNGDKIKNTLVALLLTICALCVGVASAQACITPVFVPPSTLSPYVSKDYEPKIIRKPDDMRMVMLLDEYIRDTKYYNALVSDFCTMTPYPMTDRDRGLNQKLRDLLIEKWAEKKGDK